MQVTAKNIEKALLKETGRSFELVRGNGYWYFIYNEFNAEGVVTRHETYSVYTMYLGSMRFDSWMYEGRAFAELLTKQEG